MKSQLFPYEFLSGWWFATFFIFPYIGNVIIPTDFHIFQRGSNHQPVAIENCHLELIDLLQRVIFHSYVNLPEGIYTDLTTKQIILSSFH
jgi:hypothetical protein